MLARTKTELLAAAVRATDGGIAVLHRLRRYAGGADAADERPERQRARPGKRAADRPAGAETGAERPIAIKKPRRRLRGLLVYLGLMLLGAIGGMALSYDLLERLLDRRALELTRQNAKLSKYAKSVARLQAQLELGQKRQAEADARTAASLAESERKLVELEGKRAQAEARLANALAARASAAQLQREGSSARHPERSQQAVRIKSGDCTLGSGNVRSALKGCIADMRHD